MRLRLQPTTKVGGKNSHKPNEPIEKKVKLTEYVVLIEANICHVATPLWPSVGVKPNTPKVGDLESSGTPECLEFDSKAQNYSHWGVLGFDWKGLEAYISKMASHWPFGHLQPKLWAKEGVKLAVWLPTTKSQESTSSRHPIWNFDTSLERSRRGLQLWFRLCCDPTLQSGVMSSQSPGTPTETISGQFRDSNLGVPRKRAIWMWPRWRAAENTIRGKVVASPESGPWWVKWVQMPVACPSTQGCFQMLLVPLPSLIPGLPTRPSTPF
jgi:hypothetical protein